MDELTVLTFNLRGAYIPDGLNAWPNRADQVVDLLRREDPDLVGFQEAQQGNLDLLEEAFPEHGWERGPEYNNRVPFAWPAVRWNPDRLRKVEAGGFWLSTTPERHSGDWETNCIRSALWIRFQLLPDGPEFVHLNTHLDHISGKARLEGSKVILEKLSPFARLGLPLLLTGDFNAGPESDVHGLFREEGFADLFHATGGRDGPEVFTFHAFTGKRVPGEERIDWILSRPGKGWRWSARSHEILTDAKPPVYPSDHYPVRAVVRLGPESE